VEVLNKSFVFIDLTVVEDKTLVISERAEQQFCRGISLLLLGAVAVS